MSNYQGYPDSIRFINGPSLYNAPLFGLHNNAPIYKGNGITIWHDYKIINGVSTGKWVMFAFGQSWAKISASLEGVYNTDDSWLPSEATTTTTTTTPIAYPLYLYEVWSDGTVDTLTRSSSYQNGKPIYNRSGPGGTGNGTYSYNNGGYWYWINFTSTSLEGSWSSSSGGSWTITRNRPSTTPSTTPTTTTPSTTHTATPTRTLITIPTTTTPPTTTRTTTTTVSAYNLLLYLVQADNSYTNFRFDSFETNGVTTYLIYKCVNNPNIIISYVNVNGYVIKENGVTKYINQNGGTNTIEGFYVSTTTPYTYPTLTNNKPQPTTTTTTTTSAPLYAVPKDSTEEYSTFRYLDSPGGHATYVTDILNKYLWYDAGVGTGRYVYSISVGSIDSHSLFNTSGVLGWYTNIENPIYVQNIVPTFTTTTPTTTPTTPTTTSTTTMAPQTPDLYVDGPNNLYHIYNNQSKWYDIFTKNGIYGYHAVYQQNSGNGWNIWWNRNKRKWIYGPIVGELTDNDYIQTGFTLSGTYTNALTGNTFIVTDTEPITTTTTTPLSWWATTSTVTGSAPITTPTTSTGPTTTSTTTPKTTTETTTLITTTTPPKEAAIKSVETINVLANQEIISTDGSDDKSTLKTINSKSLSFGSIAPGETSESFIIYLKVPSSSAINNIKLGLIDCGGLDFSLISIGVETRTSIMSTISYSSYFKGINNSNDPYSPYNISIGNKDLYTSNYVYINLTLPRDQIIGSGVMRFKWFFDYS